ncbi:phytoene dehydrogenase-like protein [Roseiarcus fermentans]|uniref:Phytoene dehydrogenase-like protein n=1 Tax=Roseiarcus fermentans TaxID=1473586 RepID=A0A366FPU6_9HYPH|nr:NAD(P)/FAD-dependent oxidoreductase [Roseiarcus fermentans]RBP16156.1 phytoene dehydrogenase-like protein [Roseiarcus fermentans]
MRTFLAANLGLSAFALFWILVPVLGAGPASLAGLAVSLAPTAWRAVRRQFRALEAGGVVLFGALGLALRAGAVASASDAVAVSFAGLGGLALLSVALGRPWTADYARAAFAAEAESPIFRLVNQILSAFWGLLFLVDAIAFHFGWPAWVTTGLFAFGALVSIFGPGRVIRLAVGWRIARAGEFRWPAPVFERRSGLDVAVVGAGIGGLTAAALLADAGLQVAVYEAHAVAGGFCHTFLRKERHGGKACLYRFDAGPHDFSGLHPGGALGSLLRRLGVADAIAWRRVDHSYVFGDRRIEPARDWREYARQLGAEFPADAAGIVALLDDIRAIFDGMTASGETTGGVPGMPDSVDAVLALPKRHPLMIEWMDRPFDELVATHGLSPEAKEVILALTGYVSDGRERLTCAEFVPLFGYYFHGGWYPAGGSDKLADALVAAIERRGGTVRLKTPVEKILVDGDRATGLRLAGGETVLARAVVSNADFKRTFEDLVDPRLLPASFRRRVAEAAPAPSAFMVHLGVDFVPDGRPAIHVHGANGIGVEILSKVDPSAAPAGHATVALIKLLTHEEARAWFPAPPGGDEKAWRRSNAYSERKREIADAMIAAAETVLPDLGKHIVHRSEASPVTYARYDRSSTGAIYGVERAARLRGAKSPIRGLVVAGAATHGPGVEAVAISGARAAEALVPGLLAGKAARASAAKTALASA